MIHSSSNNIHNLVVSKAKKMGSQHEQHQHHLGFHFNLMRCSTSDVVERKAVYCKLDPPRRSVSSGGSSSARISSDVPKGCLAVYVGEERQRYIIRAHLLNHPVFRPLLEESASEFGFKHSGGLKFACDTRQFEQMLLLVKNKDSDLKDLGRKSF